MSVRQLPKAIKGLCCQGSSNLLTRCINQGRVESERPAVSPRRLWACCVPAGSRPK
ncbi:hypothetical protein [Streptomyces sp. SID3343]|uniref:hypothetical protein n=1 Tax=Streptomyces sp. SID3343 TaxID=2690260 RepID=UPI00136871E4|nr:hypothetical protein [Streptomyces sp. SID3343]MYV96965.1 hypothetical protein [Streptomyces sp. SID3343]